MAALSAWLVGGLAFAGSLAAATADTWAREIGRHSPIAPRLITNGTRVPPGTDGGMTLLGTAGGIAGAGFVAGLSYVFGQRSPLAIALAGVGGMLVGSRPAATGQGKGRRGGNTPR